MALMHELNPAEATGSLSDESKGLPFGELIRDYEPASDTKWRFGKPNYARVNKAYFKNRVKTHKEGSLEAIVSKIVKNWEVESHHISDVKQWKTMDTGKFTAQLNGGPTVNAQLMCDIGPYNMLIGETPEYSSGLQTFESANTIFSNVFPDGFAWECLEVLSGPPTVTFKWRHFGEYTGEYTDRNGVKHKGNGETINVIGMCIAKVNDSLLIESLDVYYNPEDMLVPLVTKTTGKEEPPASVAPPKAAPPAKPADNCVLM